MKLRWDKLGGQLGILYCLVGAVLIFLGWNGAASYDRVSAQIPYVVSGGIGGLALVVLGSALIITQSHRDDRAALQATLEDLREALGRVAAAEEVVAVAHGAAAGADVRARRAERVPPAGLPPDRGPGRSHADDRRGRARSTGLEACRICAP